jgi:hypothetical protein
MKIENDNAALGGENLLGWTKVNLEGLTDTNLLAWPNLWHCLQGNVIQGEKHMPEYFSLVQDPPLRYSQETLEERSENGESSGGFLT